MFFTQWLHGAWCDQSDRNLVQTIVRIVGQSSVRSN